jgi:hypothetical protein
MYGSLKDDPIVERLTGNPDCDLKAVGMIV